MMTPKVAAAVVADPFAAPPTTGTMPMASPPATARQGMDQAFQAVRENDLAPAGVPSGKSGWMLPVIVGVIALLVGGAATLVVMMGH